MSLLKTIKQQLGLSVTPANNFTFDASADNGTMKLARGNAGATTQDILTVDASGSVRVPSQVTPTFVADVTNSGTATGPVNVGGITSVTTNLLGTWAANKYTPARAGYYFVSFSIGAQMGTALMYNVLSVRKNGSNIMTNIGSPYSTSYSRTLVTGMVYLNGTTDYLEFYQDISGTGAASVLSGYIHVRHMGDL